MDGSSSTVRTMLFLEFLFLQGLNGVCLSHAKAGEAICNFYTRVFEIAGAVFGQPSPFQVVLKSELDLECGEFQLTEDFD